ncbi:MAG: PRC-barrel domain-containing protein [Thermoplasmata archaeon]|nr:MAG: PRC-barrel domain-containing protein [Thermoplasmata archaeon]
MLQEISEIIGMQVYTPGGTYLGNVDNLVMDMENKLVNGIFIRQTNPLLVEESISISIPYRWIQSIGDVVILKYFPRRVAMAREEIAEF